MENEVEIIDEEKWQEIDGRKGERKKQRLWTCTLNNPEKTDEQFFEFLKANNELAYFCFRREKAPTTGTIHFQFFLAFLNQKHFSTVKNFVPTAHIQPSEGTKAQNRAYCMKLESAIGEFYEHGEIYEEGKRYDLIQIQSMINQGVDLETVETAYPSQFMMYEKMIKSTRARYLSRKFGSTWRDITVSYIWGTTGIGKSRTLADKFGYKNIYRVTEYDQRAFDNYEGQDIIVFEEFRSLFKISQMLNYLDGHPLRLPCRFEDKQAAYTRVFITTNLPIYLQYKNIQTDEAGAWDAFRRRIHNIYNFDNKEELQKFLEDKPNKKSVQIEMVVLSEAEKEGLPF